MLSSSLVLFFQLPLHASQSVTLAWDANHDSTIAGYRIYFGTASHRYTEMVDVGNVTNAIIPVPAGGTTYYFAATTYDDSGEESDFSDEVVFDVPATTAVTNPIPAVLTAMTGSAGQFGVNITGTPGAQYVLLASTNLTDWTPVVTNAAPFKFTDTNTAKYHQRFFRVMAAASSVPAPTSTAPAVAATLTIANLSGGTFGVNLAGTPGAQYVVQASTNLVDWVSVQTNAAPFTYVDTNTASYSRRFFRAFSLSP